VYTEELETGVGFVVHNVRGTLEAVLKRVGELFGQYHPLGYATQANTIRYRDGRYEAVVWRAKSCD
jgi:hypothetical protein